MQSLLLVAADFEINVLEELAKQGPVTAILALICFLLYRNQKSTDKKVEAMREKHEADIRRAYEKMEEYIREDRDKVMTALNNNTEVLADIKEEMKKK